MSFFQQHAPLYTDFYQLTMAQGYFLSGRKDVPASFEYFYRENPFQGGYVLFAGISDLLEILESMEFGNDDIEYLRSQGFRSEFLDYLRSFRFRGTIASVQEGEVIFPLEPVVRVDGNIIETQIIETLLLNLINFESLIATKASRVCVAAGDRRVVDFGLRRAQGLGGIHGSKAAVIGGVRATSNVYSAYQFGLETSGTQAHSWIQSYDDELTSFRKFAEYYPDRCILLVDTYNTLRSGIPNAITVAKELEAAGHRLSAVRLDSGDLAYLSKKSRQMLDDAGLPYVKIVASNQLDEYLIRSLLQQGAPIDSFGVGTRLITAHGSPALDGVYKLCMSDGKPRLKFSENYAKTTLPGLKTVMRYRNNDGMFYADGITLETESSVKEIYHPSFPDQHSDLSLCTPEPLLKNVMEHGKLIERTCLPQEAASYARERLAHCSAEHKRFEYPHIYKVGISSRLMELRSKIVEDFQHSFSQPS
ncbi:MAG TPA: nicotinate phosphoribosyltransferase [Bacteroidota bacterium]